MEVAPRLGRMRTLFYAAVAGLVLHAAPAQAQEPDGGRLLPAALGAVGGTAAGGYIAVSIIVLESRVGRYVHDIDDVLGWRSAPVLIGGGVGAVLGYVDPDRLLRTTAYGAAGLLAGGLIGRGAGMVFGRISEHRWAGMAIGAGAGLVIGNSLGLLLPSDVGPLSWGGDDDGGGGGGGAAPSRRVGIPIIVRLPL